jgi:hypothetical protein
MNVGPFSGKKIKAFLSKITYFFGISLICRGKISVKNIFLTVATKNRLFFTLTECHQKKYIDFDSFPIFRRLGNTAKNKDFYFPRLLIDRRK